jgi:hypothetical protein
VLYVPLLDRLLLTSIRANDPLRIDFFDGEGCLRSMAGDERCFDLLPVGPSVFTFFLGFVLSWSEERARLVAIGLKKKEGPILRRQSLGCRQGWLGNKLCGCLWRDACNIGFGNVRVLSSQLNY